MCVGWGGLLNKEEPSFSDLAGDLNFGGRIKYRFLHTNVFLLSFGCLVRSPDSNLLQSSIGTHAHVRTYVSCTQIRNMKLLSFASALLLLNGAASQICPNSIELGAWGETFLGEGESFIFRHAIILASNPNESSILCGRLETIGETYIAFGISPAGTMEGGEAIIGLPDPDSGGGTVKKYTLSGSRSATEMPPEKQTLMYTTVTQEEGRTVMEFAKYLKEDGDEEHEIDPSGVNTFIYALGTANTLGYHSVKGSFTVEFDATLAPTPFQTAGE